MTAVVTDKTGTPTENRAYGRTPDLPWTTEWLLHYELWLIIGYWAGGGDTHATGGPVRYVPNRGA